MDSLFLEMARRACKDFNVFARWDPKQLALVVHWSEVRPTFLEIEALVAREQLLHRMTDLPVTSCYSVSERWIEYRFNAASEVLDDLMEQYIEEWHLYKFTPLN